MNASQPVTGFAAVLKSLNGDGRYGLALLGLVTVLLVPEIWGDSARWALRFDRDAMAAGQWWRAISCHWVHLDATHAVLNVLGLILMWALFARDFTSGRWAIIWLASSLAISAGIWLFNLNVLWYVGASGALHGVMTAGTLAHVRRRDLDAWILVAFIVAKLGFEQWSGAMPFDDGGTTLSDAHLYGAIGGLIAALFLESRRSPA
jgi:rhomboid family GlyGly-CTERM serine protease